MHFTNLADTVERIKAGDFFEEQVFLQVENNPDHSDVMVLEVREYNCVLPFFQELIA